MATNRVRGIRQKTPSGVLFGRASKGVGKPEMMTIDTLRRLIGLSPGGVSQQIDAGVSAYLDSLSSTHGAIIYRDSAAWQALAPGTSGHFLKTNGSGADPAWAAASGGGGGPFSPPSTSTLSQSYEDAGKPATITYDASFGYSMAKAGGATSTDSVAFRGQAVPGSTPWTITARFWANARSTSARIGLGLTNGTAFSSIKLGSDNASINTAPLITTQRHTNTTTFSATIGTNRSVDNRGPVWFRITDNGTNNIFEYSFDGIFWITHLTEARATYLTATHVGIISSSFAPAADSGMVVIGNCDYYAQS